MKSKTVRILAIVMALHVLAACTKSAAPSGNSTQPPPQSQNASSTPPENNNAIPAEYTSLIAFSETVARPGLYWNSEAPCVEYNREHINVTEELRAGVYKLLTEHTPVLRPDILDDDSRDRMGGTIIFSIYDSDDGIYPNSDQLAFAAVAPLGANDPAAPNSTFLAIGVNEDNYIYPAEVYNELLALFEANTVETHADFEGEYVRLAPSKSEDYQFPGEMIECGDVLLYTSYYGGGYISDQSWWLEAFDPDTGESLYTGDSSSVPEDRGPLLRISNLTRVPGYNYVMYNYFGYAYRDSKDAAKEIWHTMPEGIDLLWLDHITNTLYDVYGDSFTWMGGPGIYLRPTKQDGTELPILANDDLPALIPDRADGTLNYVAPRFICGGTKIVASILHQEAQETVAAVVYDIAAGKISGVHEYVPPYYATYPVRDRYLAVGYVLSQLNLIDAKTGEVTEIPGRGVARSHDYETYIISRYSSLDANNAPAYVCDIGNWDNMSRPLLRARQAQASVNLSYVTENYAVFSVRDFDGEWTAVSKYR